MDDRLKLLIKIAAIGLTAPATIEVAGSVYPENVVYRVMVQVAALILVEGALMLGWHKLDTDKQATTAQRWLYAGIAIVAYMVLWAVAIAHQEGGAAWFRATLGVLLVYSIAESGIASNIKINAEGARNILSDLQVRIHARKLDRKEAKAEREAMHRVRIAFLDAEQSGGLHAASLYSERLQSQNAESHAITHVITHDTTHDMPSKWDKWVDPRQQAKNDTMAEVAEILKVDPAISNYQLAKRIGKSEATARRHRQALETALPTNGHKH